MFDAIETIELDDGRRIQIHSDDDPINPRKDFDHAGTMVCWHDRSRLGDEQRNRHDGESIKEEIDDLIKSGAVVLPLYLYEHSSMTMRTSAFSDPWDSGQVGFIYMERATILKEWGGKLVTAKRRAEAIARLLAEVEEYDQYLRGDVYGYVIEDEEGEHIDSCWGFYGFDYCVEEAKAAAGEPTTIYERNALVEAQ